MQPHNVLSGVGPALQRMSEIRLHAVPACYNVRINEMQLMFAVLYPCALAERVQIIPLTCILYLQSTFCVASPVSRISAHFLLQRLFLIFLFHIQNPGTDRFGLQDPTRTC